MLYALTEAAQQVVVVDLTQTIQDLRGVSIQSIRDIRSVGEDLLLTLDDASQLLIQQGALLSLTSPQLLLQFSDGILRLEQLFQQTEWHDLRKPGSALDIFLDAPGVSSFVLSAHDTRHDGVAFMGGLG